MSIQHVLIAEESSPHHIALHNLLRKKKCAYVHVFPSEEAIKKLSEYPFDLVICNLDKKGLDILKKAKSSFPSIPVVALCEPSHKTRAAQAIKLGAFRSLNLPLSEGCFETLLTQLQDHLEVERKKAYLNESLCKKSERKKHELIAESTLMKEILSDVAKVANSSASVFISGESGTGKEVIAQAIHTSSSRTTQPFIKVNCAAIPATLLESEFFGHEKGAFTGALQRKPGRFELANKGTLLLDEVSEIPPELQAKLLRAIQEREFERVGGTHSIRVDTRLIATSNRPIKEAIQEKLFREDLYYRLNVIPIQLPPLRERREDIIPLAEFFLKRLCEENQKTLKRLCLNAKRKLLDYSWPGNIRELANAMERTVIMNASDTIEAHQVYLDLSCPVREAPQATLPVGVTLAELEKRLILETLAQEKGNRTRSASILGISLRTLRNKIRTYKSS